MMTKPLFTLLLATLVLTGCSTVRDSRINPFNWFGRANSQPVNAAQEDVNPLIPARRASAFFAKREASYEGALVGEVTQLQIERRPGGAIVHAVGVADFQGAFEVKLIKDEANSDAQTLEYELKAYQPKGMQGSVRSRSASAALWLSDHEMDLIKTIRVRGLRNVQSVRR